MKVIILILRVLVFVCAVWLIAAAVVDRRTEPSIAKLTLGALLAVVWHWALQKPSPEIQPDSPRPVRPLQK